MIAWYWLVPTFLLGAVIGELALMLAIKFWEE